jgi:CheY-like chemotaxis protein
MTGARLLVVDDEEALLQLLQKYLLRLGYQVDISSSAPEAWRRFEAEPDRFDLVIADLSMPEMSGDELVRRMLTINSSLQVVICSGYPFSPSSLPDGMRANVRFLQKPFLPRMLADQLKNMLR